MNRRSYTMTTRRDTVEQTRERILRAAYEAWLAGPYDEITLDSVAEAAGVTRQTVLRHFGSKDDLAFAVAVWQRPQEEQARAAAPGDTATALRRLIDRYETMGDANVRLLELEERIPALGQLFAEARTSHRGWIEHTFAPWLDRLAGSTREETVMALYAATDVTVWKLLRRDFGRSRARTESIMRRLVDGVLGASDPKGAP